MGTCASQSRVHTYQTPIVRGREATPEEMRLFERKEKEARDEAFRVYNSKEQKEKTMSHIRDKEFLKRHPFGIH